MSNLKLPPFIILLARQLVYESWDDRRLEIRLPVSGLERCPGCHSERSEESLHPSSQTLRCAQGDRYYLQMSTGTTRSARCTTNTCSWYVWPHSNGMVRAAASSSSASPSQSGYGRQSCGKNAWHRPGRVRCRIPTRRDDLAAGDVLYPWLDTA